MLATGRACSGNVTPAMPDGQQPQTTAQESALHQTSFICAATFGGLPCVLLERRPCLQNHQDSVQEAFHVP